MLDAKSIESSGYGSGARASAPTDASPAGGSSWFAVDTLAVADSGAILIDLTTLARYSAALWLMHFGLVGKSGAVERTDTPAVRRAPRRVAGAVPEVLAVLLAMLAGAIESAA